MRTSSPLILAIDTSTRRVGIGLTHGGEVLAEHTWTSQDYHTVELAPAVNDMLTRSGIKPSDLAAIAVAKGPGSFTGLRIGLALSKGLCLALHIPVIGVATLDILAAAQPVMEIPLASILRAGRGRLAVGWYQAKQGKWQAMDKLQALTIEELNQQIQSQVFLCGELNDEERRLLIRHHKTILLASPAQSLRRPAYLAEIGLNCWMAGKMDAPETLAPVYLHYHDPIPE